MDTYALLLAATLPAAQAQVTKLRVSTIPIIDTAPLQAAIAKGFFAAEGLEVDTTPTQGGAVGLPALAAGQVQITFSNIISIALGVKQGLPFRDAHEVVAHAVKTATTKGVDLAALSLDELKAFDARIEADVFEVLPPAE